jgi:hypothetical protein
MGPKARTPPQAFARQALTRIGNLKIGIKLCWYLVDKYSIMENMKDTVTIILSTLVGYALWLLLAMVVLGGAVRADTPTQAIHAKDGKACAAMFDDAIKVNIRPECVSELAPTVSCILGSSLPIALRLGGVLLLSRRTMTDGSRLAGRGTM